MGKLLKSLVFMIIFMMGIVFLFNRNVYATESIDLSYYMEDTVEIYDLNSLELTGFDIYDYKDNLLGDGISKVGDSKIIIVSDDPIINIVNKSFFYNEGSYFITGEGYNYYCLTEKISYINLNGKWLLL